jgi:hypothetical protein
MQREHTALNCNPFRLRSDSYAGRCHMSLSCYVTCITIIYTIILTNYTNDAYIFDTYTPLRQPVGPQ